MSLSYFFECDVVLSKAALSCWGRATGYGRPASLKVLFPCLYSAVPWLCSQLPILDEPLMAGGRMQGLSQLSSMMPVQLNEQPNLPSLRTVWRQWWIQSPELLTSPIAAKLISDFWQYTIFPVGRQGSVNCFPAARIDPSPVLQMPAEAPPFLQESLFQELQVRPVWPVQSRATLSFRAVRRGQVRLFCVPRGGSDRTGRGAWTGSRKSSSHPARLLLRMWSPVIVATSATFVFWVLIAVNHWVTKALECFNCGLDGAAEVSAGAIHLLKAGHPVGWVSVYTIRLEFPKPSLPCLCSLEAPQLCVLEAGSCCWTLTQSLLQCTAVMVQVVGVWVL